MSDSQDTLIQTNTILDAIARLGDRVESLRRDLAETNKRLDSIEARLTYNENQVQEVKRMQFSFDIQLERLVSLNHETVSIASKSLSISHDLRADVKILRTEVISWAADVFELQQKAA